MTAFHVCHNGSTLQLDTVGGTIGTLHVILVVKFDERIAPGFSGLLILDELEILHRPKDFQLAQQLALCNFVGKSANKESIVAVHSLIFTSRFFLLTSIRIHQGF
jgi:hypothetical protein